MDLKCHHLFHQLMDENVQGAGCPARVRQPEGDAYVFYCVSCFEPRAVLVDNFYRMEKEPAEGG